MNDKEVTIPAEDKHGNVVLLKPEDIIKMTPVEPNNPDSLAVFHTANGEYFGINTERGAENLAKLINVPFKRKTQ